MRKVALIILDGWGKGKCDEFNAICQAGTPNLDAICREYSCTTLGASGLSVGLPEGQMGNSEVGHLNIGAGRVVYQDYTRINLAIQDGSFFKNAELVKAVEAAKKAGGAVHLMGLVSDGGVHSHNTHLYALLKLCKELGAPRVFVHCFMDGRDTPPKSGLGYIEELLGKMGEIGAGRIATISGRYYAMDRDTRWDRVEKAFDALARGKGVECDDPATAMKNAYDKGETDEFIVPVVITQNQKPVGTISDGDSVIFFNFRSDRARELTRAFMQADFAGFAVADRPKLSDYVCFTEYDETFGLPMAFGPVALNDILAEVISKAGLKQLRIAETEKYAHVTFFFNGGVEKSWEGENRVLIPSPREVKTYDEKPEMSAYLVRDRLLTEVENRTHDVIVVNFANLDMVGHTGVMPAAMSAVRAVDACVGDLFAALKKNGYATLITADHGNADEMWDFSCNQPMTAHTTNPVPLILADEERKGVKLRQDGILADIAPTMLEIMGIQKPEAMTGRSLIAK